MATIPNVLYVHIQPVQIVIHVWSTFEEKIKNLTFPLLRVLVYLSKHSASIIGLFGEGYFSAEVVRGSHSPAVARNLNDFGCTTDQKRVQTI